MVENKNKKLLTVKREVNPSLDQFKFLWLGKKKKKYLNISLMKWPDPVFQGTLLTGVCRKGESRGSRATPAMPSRGRACSHHGHWLFSSSSPSFPFLHRHPFFLRLLSWKIPDFNNLVATLIYSLNLGGKANSGTSFFPRKFCGYQDRLLI